MESELMKMVVSQGIFATLFVWLFIDTRKESKQREEKLQVVISKNQDIISDLSDKISIVVSIKEDVEEIKNKIGI